MQRIHLATRKVVAVIIRNGAGREGCVSKRFHWHFFAWGCEARGKKDNVRKRRHEFVAPLMHADCLSTFLDHFYTTRRVRLENQWTNVENAHLEVCHNQWTYAQATKEVLGSKWVTTIQISFPTFLFLVALRTKEKGELQLYSRQKVTKILGQSQL